MRAVLVDTDVVSYLFKKDRRAVPFAEVLKGRQPVVSFMTVAELYQWAAIRRWGKPRISHLEEHLQTGYAVLPYDRNVCRQWADIRAECQWAGRPISAQDAWIAATALAFDIPLVTHNSNDFTAVSRLQIVSVEDENPAGQS